MLRRTRNVVSNTTQYFYVYLFVALTSYYKKFQFQNIQKNYLSHRRVLSCVVSHSTTLYIDNATSTFPRYKMQGEEKSHSLYCQN
jgi:hypothetical protein